MMFALNWNLDYIGERRGPDEVYNSVHLFFPETLLASSVLRVEMTERGWSVLDQRFLPPELQTRILWAIKRITHQRDNAKKPKDPADLCSAQRHCEEVSRALLSFQGAYRSPIPPFQTASDALLRDILDVLKVRSYKPSHRHRTWFMTFDDSIF